MQPASGLTTNLFCMCVSPEQCETGLHCQHQSEKNPSSCIYATTVVHMGSDVWLWSVCACFWMCVRVSLCSSCQWWMPVIAHGLLSAHWHLTKLKRRSDDWQEEAEDTNICKFFPERKQHTSCKLNDKMEVHPIHMITLCELAILGGWYTIQIHGWQSIFTTTGNIHINKI